MRTNLAETSGASPPSLSDLETKIGTDRRLYLPLSFDDYLANHPDWEITRRHADRIIKSARIADAVNQSKMSDWFPDVPNESVARVLANLPEEKAAEVYAAACTNAEGEEPKTKDMQEAIAKLFGGDDPASEFDDNEAEVEDSSDFEGDDAEAGSDVDNDEDDVPEEDDDEEEEDTIHDYVVTITCKPADSQPEVVDLEDVCRYFHRREMTSEELWRERVFVDPVKDYRRKLSMLSVTQRELLDAASEHERRYAQTIADRAGHDLSGQTKGCLSVLVKLGLLDKHRGYLRRRPPRHPYHG